MNHKGTVTMETQRLLLRRFTLADSEESFRNWTGDDRVTEFLRWPTHASVEITREILQTWIEGYQKDDFYQWAIVPKALGEPIGAISVVEQNEALGSVDIGYCIGSRWWHQGYTSEALEAVIPFFFDQVGANRIASQHDPLNPDSGKVMAKCGMKLEGVLRQADVSNRGIVDAAIYGILAEEYGDKLR
ncbi:MAG: GNAT family protein [Oscillospiraceae bacterium]